MIKLTAKGRKLLEDLSVFESKWLNIGWYHYLGTSESLENLICRIKGHPDGVWWYNVNGYEPDMTCKDCGEDLG